MRPCRSTRIPSLRCVATSARRRWRDSISFSLALANALSFVIFVVGLDWTYGRWWAGHMEDHRIGRGGHNANRPLSRTFGSRSAVTAALFLGACNHSHHLTASQLAAARPANRHVAQLYAQSCKACHAEPGSGAPLVHDHDAWDSRWAKGEDVLLSHAILGFQAMPAGGQCADCTSQDISAIIRFMADRESKK